VHQHGHRLSCEGARRTVPSPHSPSKTGVNALVEGQGGGRPQMQNPWPSRPPFIAQKRLGNRKRENGSSAVAATPLPVPPPQGGRERCGTALPISNNLFASALPRVL